MGAFTMGGRFSRVVLAAALALGAIALSSCDMVTSTTCSSLTVTWDPPANAGGTAYVLSALQTDQTSPLDHYVVAQRAPGTGLTSSTITGLRANTTYFVRKYKVVGDHLSGGIAIAGLQRLEDSKPATTPSC